MLQPQLPTLARYEIVGLLGRGGMAVVYLARHRELRSWHAIKVLAGSGRRVAARLVQEGRVQSALRHPNVVAVTDLVEVESEPALVMEYVDGPSLDQLLRSYRPTADEVDLLARGILDGVAAAHRAGVVHRDLKPGNVLIAVHHDRVVPKVADFGLVKVLAGDEPESGFTRTGASLGTPAYMAPEQIRDAAHVDARADVFALGCILYELATGRLAFEGADTFEIHEKIVRGRVLDPRLDVPDLPAHRAEAILAALRTDRDARLPSAEALLSAWTAGHRAPEVDWSRAIAASRAIVGDRLGSVDATDDVSGGTWVQATGAEPASIAQDAPSLADGPATTVPDRATTTAAAPQRPWRRFVAVAAVVALVATAAWWAGLPGEPAAHVLTRDAVVVLGDDPVIQQQFADGWQAYLDADLRGAINHLEVVVATDPPDPLPWMVLAQARFNLGDNASAVQAAWTARDKIRSSPGPLAEFMPPMLRANFGEPWAGEIRAFFFDYCQRYPTDLFARLSALDTTGTMTDAEAEEVYREALKLAPDAAIVELLYARDRTGRGLWSEAQAAARRGLATHPASATLTATLGRALLEQGAAAEARPVLERAVTLDPALVEARVDLAIAAYHLGDEPGAAALTQAMLAGTTPLQDQLAFALRLAEALGGLGRVTEASEMLGGVAARAQREAAWPVVVQADRSRIDLLAIDRRWDAQVPVFDHARAALAAPELAPELRQRWSAILLHYEGMRAAATGRRDEADAVRARLAGLKGGFAGDLTSYDHGVAVLSGDASGLRPDTYPPGCYGRVAAAVDLAAVRAADAAVALREALADTSACSAVAGPRRVRAEAWVALAELANTHEERAEAVDAFRALQPKADPEGALSRRLAALPP